VKPWWRYPRELIRAWRANRKALAQARRVAREKLFWRCVRDGGGGILITPKPMTREYAMAWLVKMTGGDIIYVDQEIAHIFYSSRARKFEGH
jgi:hypothetical protein